jgi:DNA-directed RNA polymerase subunit RPC12/RpoP
MIYQCTYCQTECDQLSYDISGGQCQQCGRRLEQKQEDGMYRQMEEQGKLERLD